MREGRTGVRLKRKEDKSVYTVHFTGDQIMTIRSLYLRVEQIWVHHGIAELVRENGKVERVPFWECHFCGKASYESAAAVVHAEECIVPIADKEFASLNAQFVAVLSKEVKS